MLIFAVCGIAILSLLAASQSVKIAEADTVTTSNGGSLTARVDSVSQAAPSGSLCPGSRNKPNFEAWITDANIAIGSPKSTLSFTTNVQWRECDNSTEAYAIFSGKFCPNAGYYGGGQTDVDGIAENIAWDCVKYIDKNTNNNDVNPSLGCAVNGKASDEKRHQGIPGHNHDCTSSIFKSLIMQKKDRPVSGNPSENDQVRSLPVPREIGTVHSGTRSSGSDSFSGNICQYYWYTGQGASQSDNSVCQLVTINYSWTYSPPYNLNPYTKDLAPYFSYVTKAPVTWGATNADGSSNVGSHNVKLWKIVYPAGSEPSSSALSGGFEMNAANPDLCARSEYNGKSACDNVDTKTCSGTVGTCEWSYSNPDLQYVPVGGQICYVAQIAKPTRLHGDNVWRTSGMVCTESKVIPKVQIRSHDLRAGGKVDTLAHVVDKRYGSWGEYGILSGGCNVGGSTSSGAIGSGGESSPVALLSGTRHSLTFANTGNSSGCKGQFGAISSPDVDVYNQGGAVNDSDKDETGVVVVGKDDGSTETYSARTKRVFYYPKATVHIKGNLEYGNSYMSVGAIPRVVIIAKDIVIDPGVTQIDAWLLASDRISTCRQYNLAGAIENNFTYAQNIAKLTADGECKQKLVMNGPVMAKNIYLLRTYHDKPEDTSADEVKKLGDPAETFNLRADAYLSSLSISTNPVATTDMITELPPRF